MAVVRPSRRCHAQFLIIGDDNKLYWDDTGKTVFTEPGKDEVVIVDIKDPEAPKIVATLQLENSIVGPPTNLAISPDNSIALVADSMTVVDDNGAHKMVTTDKLWVIDLKTNPPKLAQTVTLGKQPSGLSFSPDGKMALVCNRADGTISVLSIAGTQVTPIGTIAMGSPGVSTVEFTPDGKHALAVRSPDNRVALLDVDGDKVSYDSTMDIPTGANPYNLALTPDGALGFVVNNGVRGNNASLTVFDARGPHPRVIDTLAIGDGPEGFAMAPDGKSAVVLLLHGSTSGPSEWPYHPNGGAVMIAIDNGKARVLPGEVKLGSVPEGVAYSQDSKYIYVGDFTDKRLHIIKVSAKGLSETGTMTLPGHPASLRGPAF